MTELLSVSSKTMMEDEHVIAKGYRKQTGITLLLVIFVAASILSSRENPKICGIDDAEVVGDLVAVDMPVPRHLFAQKS